jgi:uncharacterized protein (TIGR02246 family)
VNLRTIEAKAFVPAKDFDISKQFYLDIGFSLVWSTEELAYFRHGNSAFLLQNHFVKEHVDNFKMHLLVENVDDWWRHVQDKDIAERFAVSVEPPQDRPWGVRDFVLFDPSGVLWRVGQSIAHVVTSIELVANAMAVEWAAAWNAHDMARMSRLLTNDADFVNVHGKHWKGIEEIELAHASRHESQFRTSVWQNNEVNVQLLRPDIGLVHLRWSIRGDFDPDGTARKPRSGMFSWLIVETIDGWRIRAAHNTNIVVLPPANQQ